MFHDISNALFVQCMKPTMVYGTSHNNTLCMYVALVTQLIKQTSLLPSRVCHLAKLLGHSRREVEIIS